MAIDTNIQTFTDSELLALNRKAQAEIYAYGSSVSGGGRTLTRVDLPALIAAAKDLEARIQDSANATNGGGIALVRFGEAQ